MISARHIARLRLHLCTLVLLACGLVPASSLAQSESDDGPVLAYVLVGNPDPSGGGRPGLLVDALVWLGDIPNRPMLEQLKSKLGPDGGRMRLEGALRCAFRRDESSPCPEIDYLTEPPFGPLGRSGPSDELRTRLIGGKHSSVWVLAVIEQFHVGGFNLSVRAMRVTVGEQGIEPRERIQTMYAQFFSDREDAASRRVSPETRGLSPPLGSKEARAQYWLGDSPNRLERAIAIAPGEVAAMLARARALPATRSIKDFRAWLETFPKLKTLRAAGTASCKAAYCGTRVLEEQPDRLLLATDWESLPWLISVNRWGLD